MKVIDEIIMPQVTHAERRVCEEKTGDESAGALGSDRVR
jgi:hypothetical protein